MTMTVIPAYGRDYTTAKAVKTDWSDGKDFIIADMFSGSDGKLINKQDADRENMQIMVRYNHLQKMVMV